MASKGAIDDRSKCPEHASGKRMKNAAIEGEFRSRRDLRPLVRLAVGGCVKWEASRR